MPAAQYAPLPNPRSVPDIERELNDAFGFGHEEDVDESVPLTRHQDPVLSSDDSNLIPGAYDFEREYEYDYPPPGSPPRPTAFALPNDIGNSNGRLPSSPVRVPAPRLSLFRKAMGAILPTHYSRIDSGSTRAIHRGGGIENDGVFANVVAKPQRANMAQTEDGEVYMVPENTQTDIPPVRTPFALSFFSLIKLCLSVVRHCTVRFCTSLLGNDCACPFWAYFWFRHDHRRSPLRFDLGLRPQSGHILLFPICRLPHHIPLAHFPRRKVRLSCWPWTHVNPIRILLSNRICR
jgi:hypothetical protein